MKSTTEISAKQGITDAVTYMWWTEQEKNREWTIARNALIHHEILSDNGTQISPKTHAKLQHSFIVVDNRILAISNQVLGRGAFGEVRYAEDEDGHAFALKRQALDGFLGHTSEMESCIAHDRKLALPETRIESSNESYIAYEYLGDMSLEKYIKKCPMDIDSALDISIQMALELDDIHQGISSSHHLKISHNEVVLKNIVIDSHNRIVRIVDFGTSKIVIDEDDPFRPNLRSDLDDLAICCQIILRHVTRSSFEEMGKPTEIINTFFDADSAYCERLKFSSALELAAILTTQRIPNVRDYLPATYTRNDILAINFLHQHHIPIQKEYLTQPEMLHVIKLCYNNAIDITPDHLTPQGIQSMLALERLAQPTELTYRDALCAAFSRLSTQYNEKKMQEDRETWSNPYLIPLVVAPELADKKRIFLSDLSQADIAGLKYVKRNVEYHGHKINCEIAHIKTKSNASIIFLETIQVDRALYGAGTNTKTSMWHLMDYLRETARKSGSERCYVQWCPENTRLEAILKSRSFYIGDFETVKHRDVESVIRLSTVKESVKLWMDDKAGIKFPAIEIDMNRPAIENNPFLQMKATTLKPRGAIVPKCLVGLGILASVGEVAASEDKIDTAIRELDMHAGGLVGATAGAMYGAPLGPIGMVSGMVLGGAMGSEIGKMAHRAIKALPPQSDMTLVDVLKRMDPTLREDASAKRTAEELFGEISDNPLRRRHSSAELLSHAKLVESPLAHPFAEATIEPLSDEDLREHTISLFKDATVRHNKRSHRVSNSVEQKHSERALAQEQYYKKCYELTERSQKLQEHFRTGEPLQPSHPTHDVSFSDGCRAISSAANDLATIANAWHLPGRRELSIIGKGTERIAAGSLLLCMENAPAFATPLGWLSVVAGIAVLTTLGDDDDENNALEELKRALVQLGLMLNQVLQNQQKIMDILDVIFRSVLDVEARVKQHQTETRATLSFISTYQLQDACLAIQGDLAKTNAVSLTSDARRDALSILERWLNQHLFHAGLSREASGPTSSKLAVETLSAYPAMNTMGLILVQLQAHLGAKHVPNEFVHLPPLNLFIHVAQLFLTGVLSAELPSDDGCEALCKKLVDVVQTYEKLIDYLRTESVIWDALFKQYEHQRNMVGRALSAANIPNQAVPIDSLVTNDAYSDAS